MNCLNCDQDSMIQVTAPASQCQIFFQGKPYKPGVDEKADGAVKALIPKDLKIRVCAECGFLEEAT